MLRSHCNVCDVIYLLRRRMPWLEDRWRTQRTVLNISNCRFPRKKRILNAFCELNLFQLTWLTVTEICSRSNSEVQVVFTCCRKFLRRRVRGIQRVSRFRAALRFQVLMFEFIDVFCFLKTFSSTCWLILFSVLATSTLLGSSTNNFKLLTRLLRSKAWPNAKRPSGYWWHSPSGV